MICAPAGFGKTEAFLLPIIDKVLRDNSLAILIYPRRELIFDQLYRILELYKRILEVYNKSLRVGIQLEGIGRTLESTLLRNHRSPSGKKFDRIMDINRMMSNLHFSKIKKIATSWNNIVKMEFIDNYRDKAIINIPKINKCPVCHEGNIYADVWYKINYNGYRVGFLNASDFKCSRCSTKFELSLSKESHIRKNVHLLLTTLESFEIMLMEPNFVEFFKKRLRFVVFDEIHVYHSIYGAHAANIVRRLKEMIPRRIKFIGASATIDNPEIFGKKFFGERKVNVISPKENDRKKLEAKEHYYFIRSYPNLTLSTYIQLAMLLGHSFLPRNKKMFFFFDSRDLVYRATNQLKDAEAKNLWKFRIDQKEIYFNNNTCKGFSKDCHVECPIFKSGECWLKFSRMIGRSDLPITEPISDFINGVISGKRYNLNARIVNATSTLELGIDDPNVLIVGQYKAPHTIYSFLQRKGRAGRIFGEDVHIFMILGDDPSDLLYFKRADNIVSQPFSLPLEPDNPYIKYLHELLKNITIEIINSGDNKPLVSAWNIMFSKILCDKKYKQFLKDVLNVKSVYEIITKRKILSENVSRIIREKIHEIQSILKTYCAITSPSEIIYDVIEKLNDYLNELRKDIRKKIYKDVKELDEKLRNLILFINKRDETSVKNLKEEIKKKCIYILSIVSDEVKLYYILVKILEKIPQIINNIYFDEYKVRRLRYEIECLRELKKALDNISLINVIKYLLRSWYFYCKVCEIENGKCIKQGMVNYVEYPMKFCPQLSYFEEPTNLILNITKEPEPRRISDIDALFSYIPYKTIMEEKYIITIRPKVDINTIKYKIENGDIYYEIDIIPSYLEGKIDTIRGDIIIVPDIIHAEKIKVDNQYETIVKLCLKCFSFTDIFSKECPNGHSNSLIPVRFYVEPIIERKFYIKRELEQLSNFLYLAEIIGYMKLSRLNINAVVYKWNKDYNRYIRTNSRIRIKARLKIPMGFSITTKGIVLKIPREALKKILDEEMRKFLKHKNSNPEDVLFHTASHVLLILVSSISGVNPELLWYGWDKERGIVAVWERYEGGTGICDIFRDVFIKNPSRILKELEKIVECPVHNAEEEFIKREDYTKNPFEKDSMEYVEYEKIIKNYDPKIKKSVMRKFYEIILNEENLNKYTSKSIINRIAKSLGLDYNKVIDYLPTCIDGCPFCIGVTYCSSGKNEQYTKISLKVAKKLVRYFKSAGL